MHRATVSCFRRLRSRPCPCSCSCPCSRCRPLYSRHFLCRNSGPYKRAFPSSFSCGPSCRPCRSGSAKWFHFRCCLAQPHCCQPGFLRQQQPSLKSVRVSSSSFPSSWLEVVCARGTDHKEISSSWYPLNYCSRSYPCSCSCRPFAYRPPTAPVPPRLSSRSYPCSCSSSCSCSYLSSAVANQRCSMSIERLRELQYRQPSRRGQPMSKRSSKFSCLSPG
jgi:hypothetical protein